jgi:hypothetical protein
MNEEKREKDNQKNTGKSSETVKNTAFPPFRLFSRALRSTLFSGQSR